MSDPNFDAPRLQSIEPILRDGSFEEALHALESVVDYLERGRLSIADAVTWYEVGLALTRRCTTLLDEAELRISTLEEMYAMTAQDDELWDTDEG